SAPSSTPALHAHLLLMAQPSGTLVFKNRTRCHCARGVHVGQGFVTQTPALYPNLQSASQALQMDLQKHAQPHQTVTQIQMLQCTTALWCDLFIAPQAAPPA